jgi:hypothetical protein
MNGERQDCMQVGDWHRCRAASLSPSPLPAGEGGGWRGSSEGRAVQDGGVDFARNELAIPQFADELASFHHDLAAQHGE